MKTADSDSSAIIVCGLGFGDEGKGTITDALARRFHASAVVRYNGGPQAGHNVVTPEGVWHCFATFGAGSFVPGCRTILSRYVLVNPLNMDVEAKVLESKGLSDIWQRLSIGAYCPVITPMQKLVGRMREIARGDARRGSCGQGVGETMSDVHNNGVWVADWDMKNRIDGKRALHRLADQKRGEAAEIVRLAPDNDELRVMYEQLSAMDPNEVYERLRFALETPGPTIEGSVLDGSERAVRDALKQGSVIFEGAQGALLDRTRGFVPHVTRSDTSCRNAIDLLKGAAPKVKPYKLGILRAYGHRHGAGPFPTEDATLNERFGDPFNGENRWQGKFRVGWLDLPLLRRGIEINQGVDGLAVTSIDRLSGLDTIRVCVSYGNHGLPSGWAELPGWQEDITGAQSVDDLPGNAQALLRFIENGLGVQIDIVSVGPRSDQKLFLR